MNKSNRRRPENKPSGLLHASENETLFAMFAEDIYSLATGVVELLFSTAEINGDWRIEGYGVACLVKDYRSRSYSIQVVDIINKRWPLYQFLHQDFCADQPHSCLITFQTDRCRVGLNFSDETEAKTFKTSLDKRLKRQNQAQESANQQSRGPQPPYGLTGTRIPSLPESNNLTISGMFDAAVSESSDKKPKPTMKRKKNTKKKKLTKADIEGPTQFEHVTHLGWNADQELQAETSTTRRVELEPEVQEILRQLEIKTVSKSDRKVIERVIDEGGGLEQLKNAKRTSADRRRSNSRRRQQRSSRVSDSKPSASDNKSIGSITAVPQSTGPKFSQQRPSIAPATCPAEIQSVIPAPSSEADHGTVPRPPAPTPPPMIINNKLPGMLPPSQSGRNALMDQIRQGADLKRTEDNQDTEQLPEPEELGGIARVLAKALADRRGQIDDSSADDSSDSDDDEWND